MGSFNAPSFWTGVISGIVGLILVMAVIVPDAPAKKAAEWVVTRKNVPTMLLPLAVILVLAGILALSIALYTAFVGLSVAPWVWIAIVVGAALIGLYLWVRNH